MATTIENTIRLNDRMSNVFSKIQNAGKRVENTFSNINRKLDDYDRKARQVSSSTGSIFKAMLGAGLVQRGISAIVGQLDNAIQRFDTLNNYTNVMGNLGIASDRANASLERMKEGLDGLPTTLQDGASAVQRFTSSNKNIEASTEMFLALNNAILAGGGSTATQQAALEQLSQAYAKGKPDMMEWRTALTAMPAQLDQVAKVMGKVNATQLGESLRKGKTSMNDFMRTLVKMNTKSVKGFKSLEAQARSATGGIRTSLTNLKTAITKGIADMLKSINNALTKAGLPEIQTMIQMLGKALQSMISTIGNGIATIITYLTPVFNLIRNIYNFISSNWTYIQPIIWAIIIVLGIYYTYTLLASVATTILNAAMTMLTNPMFWIIAGLIAIVAALIYFWNTNDEVAYGILMAWDGLLLGAMALKLGAVEAFYAIIVGALLMYQGILTVVLGAKTLFYSFVLGAQSMALGAQTVAQNIVNAFVWMYNKLVELLNKLGANMSTVGYANFTSGTVNAMSKTMANFAKSKAETLGEMEGVSGKIDEYVAKMKETANKGATDIQKTASSMNASRQSRTQNRNKLNIKNISSAVKQGIGNWSPNMNDLANTVGNGGSGKGGGGGGKAVKTTSTDKNLLSDEDIQLLLDVATRDYKLNYQQVTPNITVTFGDVRETADVDSILDQVATKIEEIYDGNLEVN